MSDFEHRALNLKENKSLVYTAMSKHYFYFRMHISKYVIEQHKVPLNPFMIYEYFMLDTVDRDLIREGNNNLVMRCDELWVFGPVSNGVLAEVKIAKEMGKTVQYFTIQKSHTIVSVSKEMVEMEDEVNEFRDQL